MRIGETKNHSSKQETESSAEKNSLACDHVTRRMVTAQPSLALDLVIRRDLSH